MIYHSAKVKFPKLNHHLWYSVESEKNWFTPAEKVDVVGDRRTVTVHCRFRRDTAQWPLKHKVNGTWYPNYRLYKAIIRVDADLTPREVVELELLENRDH